MRLAQGQVRRIVADRAHGNGCADGKWRSGTDRARNGSISQHEEIRSRGINARRRGSVIPLYVLPAPAHAGPIPKSEEGLPRPEGTRPPDMGHRTDTSIHDVQKPHARGLGVYSAVAP